MTLQQRAADFCTHHGLNKTYWVALSGGLDSSVLLAVFADLRQTLPLRLRAIHIHHGLSPHASSWASHCAKVCADFQVELIEQRIQVDLSQGQSLEEAARTGRYAAFATCLEEGDVLLTAHQQEDQAE